jgi:hypothetical protein
MHRRSPAALTLALVATLGCHGAEEKQRADEETARRYAYVAKLAEREGATAAHKVMSRGDVHFEDGFSDMDFDPPSDLRGKSFRWVGRRAHLLLKRHGDKKMHLLIAGWANLKVIDTRPIFSVRFNGAIVSSDPATKDGAFGTDVVIEPSRFGGADWADVYLQLSAVAFDWVNPPALKVALVTEVSWTEEPGDAGP